ncbi:hypothetical protein CK203_082433 [Vitis vinifera]|uniref:Uncharacterized protein n=1 Tax=Vitis vinifera TaxID=29760 RepID=A0A438BNF6_VITVI|nr:hypothetical protein CK203_082433 [Vitis vinifera]
MSVQMVNCVGVGRFLNWASMDARGAAGGRLLFWDNRVLEEVGGGKSMIGSEKEDFWEELGAIRGLWEDPWCIGGDFNAIEGFKDLVRSWWNGYFVEGYGSHCIAEKLKALKKDLKKWNKEVAKAKRLALEDYKKWALLEETSWRQKSREIWLREEIKEGVCRVYQSLLLESGDWRPSINGLNFKALGEDSASNLEVMFSEEEIFAALSSCYSDKAPEFYLNGTFQRSLNSTFLVLIPKKEGAEDLRDFKSISLVGSVYKLLAKMDQLDEVVLLYGYLLDPHQWEPFKLLSERNGGFISGFKVGGRGREGLIVSHLLFADDTLIFCDTNAEQLQYLSWTFMWFEAISRLKVNLSKSEAIPVGEGVPMETLAPVLGCKIGSLPTSYLGLPLGAPYKSTKVWDVVEERFKKRVYAKLEKIQRDFLWGGGALENRPHLVSWKIICAAKKDEGLGICSLTAFNKALLGKWLWRFANENDPLWKQIITGKPSEMVGRTLELTSASS